jgi:anti-anti-sigma factor
VVAVRGELDLGTAPELEGPLEEAVGADEPLLIDLSECDFIDSTGIAMIVRAWQRLGNGDAGDQRVVICSANEQVRRVLEITGLELSIPVHESRDAALAALRGA